MIYAYLPLALGSNTSLTSEASAFAGDFVPRFAARTSASMTRAQRDSTIWVPEGPSESISGAAAGPLSGLTFAAKDLYDVSPSPDRYCLLTRQLDIYVRYRPCDRPAAYSCWALPSRPTRVPNCLPSVFSIQVKGYITGFGQPSWRQTHPAASSTAPAVQVRHLTHSCGLLLAPFVPVERLRS